MSTAPSQRRRDYLSERIAHRAREALPFGTPCLRVPISIAGIRFDLLTGDIALERRLRTYFAKYLSSGPALAELWLEPLTPPAELPELWEDEESDFLQNGHTVIHRDFVALRIDSSAPTEPPRALALVNGLLADAFHNLLRWFAPRVLLSHRCFLLHGGGIVRDGRGYVFFGQSGAGKSTSTGLVSALDRQAYLLGDDAVIIQLARDGTPFLHSAPLGCGYSTNAPEPCSVPIAGLFNLRQAQANRIEPLTASQGVATLLASAMHTSSSEELEPRFELALGFARSDCGIDALHFKPDPSFWPLVLEAQGAEKPNSHPPRRSHAESSPEAR